jgi:hypothetical protein
MEYLARMKLKTRFYAAVGLVTVKTGKFYAKRKARKALRGSRRRRR